MIPENVASGWAKTGLYPFNPAVVLDQLKKTANKEVPELEETLFSPKDHMAAILAANPSRDDRHFIRHMHELEAENALLKDQLQDL
jgi:hypothetical protein